MAKVVPGTRGGAKIPVKAAKPVTLANPWNLPIPGLPDNGGGIIPARSAVVPVAPTASAAAPAAPTPAPTIDWNAVLALDPGLGSVNAGADASVKNSLINYGAGDLDPATLDALKAAGFNVDAGTLAAAQANPFSVMKQLKLSLGQNLHSNSRAANHHGTLFSGATAQGAENANRANQQSRFNATQSLIGQIGAQGGVKAQGLVDAQGRVAANPALYGIPTQADPGSPDPTPTAPTAPKPPTPPKAKLKPVVGPQNRGLPIGYR